MNEEKAIGQFKLGAAMALSVFDTYGQGVHIKEAVSSLADLALQLHGRLSGKDVPIKYTGRIHER